jgi:hypothetical protein
LGYESDSGMPPSMTVTPDELKAHVRLLASLGMEDRLLAGCLGLPVDFVRRAIASGEADGANA